MSICSAVTRSLRRLPAYFKVPCRVRDVWLRVLCGDKSVGEGCHVRERSLARYFTKPCDAPGRVPLVAFIGTFEAKPSVLIRHPAELSANN